MRAFTLTLGCLAIAAITLAEPQIAAANDADFKLVNRTGYQIDEVYISPASSSKWGPDVLGNQAMGDGDVATITFPQRNGICVFDLKVKYHDDGSTAEWSKVDLCQYSAITLYWDAKAQVRRAVGE